MAAQREKWERVSSTVRSPLPTIVQVSIRPRGCIIERMYIVGTFQHVLKRAVSSEQNKGRESVTYCIVVAPEIYIVKAETVVVEDMGYSTPPRLRTTTTTISLQSAAKTKHHSVRHSRNISSLILQLCPIVPPYVSILAWPQLQIEYSITRFCLSSESRMRPYRSAERDVDQS